MKNQETGFKRIINAFGYSVAGIKACLKTEAAFRQEAVLAVIMLIAAFLIKVTAVERVVLISTVILVLIIELFNSAIEALADKISPEYDEHIKKAKDIGSAAVMLSLLLAGISWIIILIG